MKKVFLALVLMFVSALSFAGMIELKPIVVKFTPSIDVAILKQAIIEGSNRRRWIVSEVAENEILATVNTRGISLTVSIKYDGNGYSIEYVESEGLKYNAKKNLIHDKYDYWVNARLNQEINRRFNQLRFSQNKK